MKAERRDHAGAADLGSDRRDRAQDRLRPDGRHLPARQARLGRPRGVVHDGAEHVRRHLVVGEVERQARQGPGRQARVQGRRSTFYVNLVKDAGEKDAANASFNECLAQYQGRQGRDVVRRDRRRRHPRGERQPGQGQERVRARARQEDEGVGLAVDLGARDPEESRPIPPRPGGTSPGRPARATSRPRARESRAAGRRSRREPGSRPTRSRSTRRPRRRSQRGRWRR